MPDNFFQVKDSTKIKDFILVPKALFTDERYRGLTIRAKLAYSFLLRRYRGTSYHDSHGEPYIIFSDTELASSIDTTEHYVSDIKASLKKLGLISTSRTTRGNAIKVYSCSSRQGHPQEFFEEIDLEEWRFYRFPVELLQDKFNLLDLNIRMYYAMLFDMMCLSQANYVVDSMGRVFFILPLAEQAKRFNLSPSTVRKYKQYLQVCGLLCEYKPFKTPSHYYLKHLACFVPNADRFANMTAAERNDWIRQLNRDFKANQIDIMNPKLQGKERLKQYKTCLKNFGLDYEKAARMITAATHQAVSRASLSKYLNGARTMPDHVKQCLDSLMANGTLDAVPASENEHPHAMLEESSPEPFNKLKFVLDKCMAYLRTCNTIRQDDIEMLCDVISSFAHTDAVTIRDDNTTVEVSQEEIISLLDDYFEGQEAGLIRILNGLGRSGAGQDSSRAMAFLRTSIISMLYQYQKHPWVKSRGVNQMEIDIYRAKDTSTDEQFSDEVKNFKLFG